MTEDEFKQAALNHAAGVLHAEICRLVEGMPFDRSTAQKVTEWIDIHRADCRRMGIDFPEMVVVGIVRLRAFEIVRKDKEAGDIEAWIVETVQKYPSITAQEIADMIRVAWPDYARARSGDMPMTRRS